MRTPTSFERAVIEMKTYAAANKSSAVRVMYRDGESNLNDCNSLFRFVSFPHTTMSYKVNSQWFELKICSGKLIEANLRADSVNGVG